MYANEYKDPESATADLEYARRTHAGAYVQKYVIVNRHGLPLSVHYRIICNTGNDVNFGRLVMCGTGKMYPEGLLEGRMA